MGSISNHPGSNRLGSNGLSPFEFVDSNSRLQALAARWQHEAVLGIDTEFVRTDTFFSRPGLVQLSTPDTIVLLDPIGLDALTPFASVLENAAVVKVMHSAAEDISLLVQITGVALCGLFDTQIAAAFCGHGPSASYRALVQNLIGVTLDKGETRSDWCARPLTSSQLHYAAEDVRYLLPLWEMLRAELERLGRRTWAEEEFLALVANDPPPLHARVRGAGKLSRRELGALSVLAQWREKEAATRDRPRGHIISDSALLGILNRAPTSREHLAGIDGISPRFVRRSARTVIELLESTQSLTDDELPLPLQVPAEHRPTVDQLRARVRNKAEALALPPEMIASRRQLEAAVIAALYGELEPSTPLISGWRAGVIGDELEPILRAL